MTNRLEKGQCLWCEQVLIAWEKALCSQCLQKYHNRCDEIVRATKRDKLSGPVRSSKRLKFPKGVP